MDIYSLITLSDVKDFIGETGSQSVTDDLIESIIESVSKLFESIMDNNILSREYTEYYPGLGESMLFPKHYPIISISGIWDDYGWTWGDDSLIDSSDYRISKNNMIIFKDLGLNDYDENIKIIYTAGYAETPYDLKQACISEVSRIYKNRKQVDILSKNLRDGSISFVSKDLLPFTKLVINKYKSRNI